MKIWNLIYIILLVVISQTCNTTEPPENKASLTLTLEDVSCTEAWIKLKTEELTLPAELTLMQYNPGGGSISQILFLSTKDSLLYIDSLLPKQTYNFQATSIQHQVSSNQANVTTLDTTSHTFTWQTFTFGERTSTLYDIAIINENNIWAVGEIYMNDSLGQPDPTLYNIIKWNGHNWNVERVYYNYQGSNFIAPLRSIFAFSNEDIWVGSNQPMYWNGNTWQKWDLLGNVWEGWINKIWGSTSNDLYAVGNGGNIVHYSNGSWTKIESGTTTDLADIYGDGENVFISGYKDFMPTVLLRYKNGVLTKVIEDDLFGYKTDTITGWIKSIWLKGNKLFSLTFYDLYRSSVDTKGEGTAMWRGDINTWGSNAVRGNDVNDIFTTGYNGILWHYNGVSWKKYDELLNTNNHYRSISLTEKFIVIAGFEYLNGIERYGFIAIGKR